MDQGCCALVLVGFSPSGQPCSPLCCVPTGSSGRTGCAPPARSGSVPTRWPCGWRIKSITWSASSVPPARSTSVWGTGTSSSTQTSCASRTSTSGLRSTAWSSTDVPGALWQIPPRPSHPQEIIPWAVGLEMGGNTTQSAPGRQCYVECKLHPGEGGRAKQ